MITYTQNTRKLRQIQDQPWLQNKTLSQKQERKGGREGGKEGGREGGRKGVGEGKKETKKTKAKQTNDYIGLNSGKMHT